VVALGFTVVSISGGDEKAKGEETSRSPSLVIMKMAGKRGKLEGGLKNAVTIQVCLSGLGDGSQKNPSRSGGKGGGGARPSRAKGW